MPDPFVCHGDTPGTPSRAPYAVVPSDSGELPTIPKGLYIGTGGDVTLRGMNAAGDVTYRNLPDASYINVRAQWVRATGTTATDIVAEA